MDSSTLKIVIFAIEVVLAIFLIYVIIKIIANREYVIYRITHRKKLNGEKGEKRVCRILKKLGPEYKVLNDLLIEGEGGRTAQIDHVVISKYGIFVIETKNKRGFIVGASDQQEWMMYSARMAMHRYGHELQSGTSALYNPILQNETHIKALSYVLGEDAEDTFVSINAFNEDCCVISPFSPATILNFSQINDFIRSYQEVILKDEVVESLFEKLKTSNITSQEARNAHVQRIKNAQTKSYDDDDDMFWMQ